MNAKALQQRIYLRFAFEWKITKLIANAYIFLIILYYYLSQQPWVQALSMGVESGGGDGGTRPPQLKNQRGTSSPRNDDISASFFLETDENFTFSYHFENKVAEIRGETKFWG